MYGFLASDIEAELAAREGDVVCFRSNDLDFPGDSDGKESAYNVGDVGLIAGLGTGNPLQRSCWENPRVRRAWRATILWVAKSWT